MFLQQRSMRDIINEQEKQKEQIRKRHVVANRNIMKQVIDTVMFLGKQEMAFLGHRESLASDPSVNIGNFLEALKYLSNYNDVIAAHLKKVEIEHRKMDEKKRLPKKRDKARKFGEGSKLTFLSNDMQNKTTNVISKEIVIQLIEDSVAWAVIADTTPDVSKHEQFSLCV